MTDFAAPAAYAVLVWWFTTGVILFLDGLPQHTFRWSMGAATLAGLGAAYALHSTFDDVTPRGAYTAFTGAIIVWGWLEMSFLMGFVTGPRKHACVERCSGWRHFAHASEAIIYNEIATLAVAACIVLASRQAVNKVGLWTFLILWAMRLSAKLNLFLGVPNVGEKLLPAHLQYLKGFFRKRSMNFLFPLSVSASTIVVYALLQRVLAADDAFKAAAYALSTSLLALAVLEHWFMVLPWPNERMWKWALRPGLDARMQEKAASHVPSR